MIGSKARLEPGQLVQRGEQIGGTIGVGADVAHVFDQRVVRAVDLPAFLHEHHIAVPTQARVARPFVAGKDDERTVLVVLGGQPVELFPKRRGDLKVVALVARLFPLLDKGSSNT